MGEKIRIRGGCLEGVEGVLTQAGRGEIVIAVGSIQRSLKVPLCSYQVERLFVESSNSVSYTASLGICLCPNSWSRDHNPYAQKMEESRTTPVLRTNDARKIVYCKLRNLSICQD